MATTKWNITKEAMANAILNTLSGEEMAIVESREAAYNNSTYANVVDYVEIVYFAHKSVKMGWSANLTEGIKHLIAACKEGHNSGAGMRAYFEERVSIIAYTKYE